MQTSTDAQSSASHVAEKLMVLERSAWGLCLDLSSSQGLGRWFLQMSAPNWGNRGFKEAQTITEVETDAPLL